MMKKYYELSYPQKSIMLTEGFYKHTSVNNICGTVIVKGKVNFKYLEKAIKYVVNNNQNFWLRFSQVKSGVRQYIIEPYDFDVYVEELDDENELENLERKLSERVFDVFDSMLFEFRMYNCNNSYGGFVLNIHHLISDSWTLGLVAREVMEIYEKLSKNEVANIDGIYNYIDYINTEDEYRSSSKYFKDKEFWTNMINREVNPAELPSDVFNNGIKATSIGERLIFSISKNKMKLISQFCAQNKTSVFNFLMAVYSIYISKIINSNNFSVGTPILNRTNYKEKNMMGMFINIIPFFFDIDKSKTFMEYIGSMSQTTISMLRHQRYPYQLMLEDLRKKDSTTPNLYNIVISYQITSTNNGTGFDYTTRWDFSGHVADDLTIQFLDLNEDNKLNVMYDYKKLKYSSDYIRNIHSRILEIINQVLDNPEIELSAIEVTNKYERNKILNKFNDTYIKYNKNNNVVKQFENVVKKYSKKIAIISNEKEYTYEELDEKSSRLATYLIKQGIKNQDIVGIMVNRSFELCVGLLAILKAGATYLPIDPEYPIDRIEYMLEDSNAQRLLVNNNTCDAIESFDGKINISESKVYKDNEIDSIKIVINPEDLMYLIYTSGSTGKPKGVMLKHKNIINFLLGTKRVIDFHPEKIMCSITTVCFDIFVLEFWGALTSGMTVVLANEKEQSDFRKLNKLCLNNSVDMIQTTPSRFMHMIEVLENVDENLFDKLKDIMVGGEGLPKALVEKFFNITNANIFNMYGPTETAVWSTIKQIKNLDINIGNPISNTVCYILNDDRNLLPPNVPGELYIGGDGVSRGYHNRKDLTNEKFIYSPYNHKEKIYNTNDLAYFTENGELVHLGRTDFQVKIRGYRIELEEIENRLIKYDGIKNVVVVADDSQKYLICYYTSDNEIDTKEVSNFLLKDLPNYMIPSIYHRMKAFPLTPNGKLDRKKLPKIELKQTKSESYETKTEKLLSKVIAEVLNEEKLSVENIDINTPFIVLGLDSLGIIQVQTKLLQYHYILNTQDFYKYNTIKLLGENIDNNIYTYKEQDVQVPIRFRHTYDDILSKIENKVSDSRYLGNVFLTGANGFIGVHILHELIKKTNIDIYCLVRGKKDYSSAERLVQKYKFYYYEDITPLLNNRIFVFDGSIVKDNLGLKKSDLSIISDNVTTIIHTAARVKHYGDYDEFNVINTGGTQNMLEFAYNNKMRFIHISSISVSGNYLVKQDNRNVDFTENDLYIGQKYTDNVYVNSKFEAEKKVFEYMEKGLDAQIHRIGILSGRYSDGVFQDNISENAFYSRIKSIIELGAVSEKMVNQEIEFTPVDLCARDIVALSKNKIADNRVFHLFDHHFVTIGDVIEVLKMFGVDVEVLSDRAFKNVVLNESKVSNNLNLLGIINDIGNLDDDMILNYNYTVNIKSDFTQKYLHLLKCDWNKIDKKYLKKIVKYMEEVGFI